MADSLKATAAYIEVMRYSKAVKTVKATAVYMEVMRSKATVTPPPSTDGRRRQGSVA